jgi:hypothetical protein|nr:MAG TPA: KacT, KacA, KacA, Complex, TOXIN [Caudoviricetes sp.]
MAETKKRKLQIRLPLEEFEALQKAANEAGKSIHNYAKTALIAQSRQTILKHSIEAYKYLCPSRNNRGCSSRMHKIETQSTKCDGNCARIKYLVNTINKIEIR